MVLFGGELKSKNMQTDYLFNGLKGCTYIKFVSLLLEDKKLPNEALDHELVGNYIGFNI